jgi:hypothetical protein
MIFETCKSFVAMNLNALGTLSTCGKDSIYDQRSYKCREIRGEVIPVKFGITAACTTMPRSVR